MKSFGDYLKQLLESRQLTVSGWARKVGITQGFASNLLAGRRSPAMEDIERWADSLELSGRDRRLFLDLAAISHLPKEAQARFLHFLNEQVKMKAELDALLKKALEDKNNKKH
jgi:transcriptional regulator with XRE-family HTH domain